jgi:quercetin dioxygenase-like cupin family protein
MMSIHRIEESLIHLGLGASAVPQPPFTGTMAWYEDYSKRTEADGVDGRLVSMHTFSESWDVWEMHPDGDEVVLVVDGTMTLHLEVDGEHSSVTLRAGEYAINSPGTWHTADVDDSASALFITAGRGTQHRPR